MTPRCLVCAEETVPRLQEPDTRKQVGVWTWNWWVFISKVDPHLLSLRVSWLWEGQSLSSQQGPRYQSIENTENMVNIPHYQITE